jgi:hypothetical protein
MLAAGIMSAGMLWAAVMALAGVPVFFPAAGFIFFLVAGYIVKLAGEIHARHVEDAQENEEREWSLRRDIDRERRNYLQLRERRRMEIERGLREEQRRQEFEESQKRRQEEFSKFVQEKQEAARRFLGQYSVPVSSVSLVGRSKVVVEVPFHKAPVHWQLIDLAEAALGLRVSIIPVRFCNKCGTKLGGPMVTALSCVNCNNPLAEQLGEETPTAAPMATPTLPSPILQRIIPRQPALSVSASANPPTAEESAAGIGAETIQNRLLEQLAEQDNLEETDWTERMELERNAPQIQARLDHANEGEKHEVHIKTEQAMSETADGVAGNDGLGPAQGRMDNEFNGSQAFENASEVVVRPSIADELLQKSKPSEPLLVVDRQGSVEVGSSVVIRAGPFKDNVGTVSIINKKKRLAKVQLKGFNTAVNIPLDFVSPSKISTER